MVAIINNIFIAFELRTSTAQCTSYFGGEFEKNRFSYNYKQNWGRPIHSKRSFRLEIWMPPDEAHEPATVSKEPGD
jgi:hypothetical protein